MKGLRSQESTQFNNFFEKVQNHAVEMDCVFFLDSCEGNDRVVDGMFLADLSGWLVPNEKAEEFEKIWKNFDEDDDWIEFFVFVNSVDGIRFEKEQ